MVKKSKFLVSGLGNFGSILVRRLFERGQKVIAIYIDAEKILESKDYVSEVVIADVTLRETLDQLFLGTIYTRQ